MADAARRALLVQVGMAAALLTAPSLATPRDEWADFVRDHPVMAWNGDRATAEVICAGHPLPLLVRDGQVRAVGEFSPMLGAYDAREWTRRSVELEPGDVLVLYTDGVFDTVGDDGRFGEERLQATLAGVEHAPDAVSRIDAALSAFEVGAQADDTAVLAVERVAVGAPAVSATAGSEQTGEELR